MNFGEAIRSGFMNYINFKDRSSRSAFWWWELFALIAATLLSIIDTALFGWDNTTGPLNSLFNLVAFIPTLALGVRRLHDTDRSGWWMLLIFLPLIGMIVLIIWWCKPTQLGPNRFGPMPADYYRQNGVGDADF
ncbi:DUF805 domain-containing protein [Thalassospira marina]|uniref:DUF805 domain-containing protein n=1 Tax=Thalassospira marina TaxID=2048283 RepID=A0ABN5FEC8_9PROT|nr:DUF805 domain-containing protein [Thalassospira marina]AUG53366.1 DUF805 domain-containing protein [Thalassospira marina]